MGKTMRLINEGKTVPHISIQGYSKLLHCGPLKNLLSDAMGERGRDLSSPLLYSLRSPSHLNLTALLKSPFSIKQAVISIHPLCELDGASEATAAAAADDGDPVHDEAHR